MSSQEPRPGTGRQRTPGLRVGHVPGVTLTKWRRVWAERLPRATLEVVPVTEAGQRAALDAGLVEMCFVRLPVQTDGLHRIPLYEEVPVVVVPKDHRLADFEAVTIADLAGETVVGDDNAATGIDKVAWGAGVMLVPHSIARSHGRKDLVYRTVTDAAPTTVALAWLEDNPNPLIDEFIGIVRGRTANSSRTEAARAQRQPEPARPAAAVKKTRPRANGGRASGGRPGRSGRR